MRGEGAGALKDRVRPSNLIVKASALWTVVRAARRQG